MFLLVVVRDIVGAPAAEGSVGGAGSAISLALLSLLV